MQPVKKRAVVNQQQKSTASSNDQSNLLELAVLADQAERIQTSDDETVGFEEDHDSFPRTAPSKTSNKPPQQQQETPIITTEQAVTSSSDSANAAVAAAVVTTNNTAATAATNGISNNSKHSGRSFNETRWNQMFEKLVAYKQIHGNCIVPYHYKDDPQLGRWVRKQRSNKKQNVKITLERINRLNSIGFAWSAYNTGNMYRQEGDDDDFSSSTTTTSSSPTTPNVVVANTKLVGDPREQQQPHPQGGIPALIHHPSSSRKSNKRERRDDDSHHSHQSSSTTNTTANMSDIDNQSFMSLPNNKENDDIKYSSTMAATAAATSTTATINQHSPASHLHQQHDPPRMIPIPSIPPATMMMTNDNYNKNHHHQYYNGAGVGDNYDTMKAAAYPPYSATGMMMMAPQKQAPLPPPLPAAATATTTLMSGRYYHHQQQQQPQAHLQKQHHGQEQQRQQPTPPPPPQVQQQQQQQHQRAQQQQQQGQQEQEQQSQPPSTDELWNLMYDRLLQYKRTHNGSVNVPYNYQDDLKLVHWVNKQRFKKKQNTLSKEQIEKLESIGFRWNVMQDKWNTMYLRLEQYKKEKGHCYVLKRFKSDPQLGSWCAKQREHKSRLSKERKELLDKIGFVWNPSETWNGLYDRIQQHKIQSIDNKNKSTTATKQEEDNDVLTAVNQTMVPPNVDDTEAISKDTNSKQQHDERKGADIAENGDNKNNEKSDGQSDVEWYCMLECLLKFRQTFGHTNVPATYKGKDGSSKLGAWVRVQRSIEHTLSAEQKQYLNMLGFEFHNGSDSNNDYDTTNANASVKKAPKKKKAKSSTKATPTSRKRNASTALDSSIDTSIMMGGQSLYDLPRGMYPVDAATDLSLSSTSSPRMQASHFISQPTSNAANTNLGFLPATMASTASSTTNMYQQVLQDRAAAVAAATSSRIPPPLPSDAYSLTMNIQQHQQYRRALQVELRKQQEELLLEQQSWCGPPSTALPPAPAPAPPSHVAYNNYRQHQDLPSQPHGGDR